MSAKPDGGAIKPDGSAIAGGYADVVATIGDDPVLRGDLVRVLQRTPALSRTLDREQRLQLEATALEQIIDERLLRSVIARAGAPVTEAEIDQGVLRLRGQIESRGQSWADFVAQSGIDEAAVRGTVELEIGLDKLVRSQLRDDRLAAAFARHRRKVDGTRLRVSHILLRPNIARGEEAFAEALARAEVIRAEVLQGNVPFAELARRHSDGPSRTRGGDLGWMTRKEPFAEEFSRQAYDLAKGDVSRPFVTAFGVHVVQVTDVHPGQLGLNDVRTELLRLMAADIVRETVARARAETPVRYSPGVAHFDPQTPADGPQPRRVVVGDGVVAEAAGR